VCPLLVERASIAKLGRRADEGGWGEAEVPKAEEEDEEADDGLEDAELDIREEEEASIDKPARC
jgi:hypothetical protein